MFVRYADGSITSSKDALNGLRKIDDRHTLDSNELLSLLVKFRGYDPDHATIRNIFESSMGYPRIQEELSRWIDIEGQEELTGESIESLVERAKKLTEGKHTLAVGQDWENKDSSLEVKYVWKRERPYRPRETPRDVIILKVNILPYNIPLLVSAIVSNGWRSLHAFPGVDGLSFDVKEGDTLKFDFNVFSTHKPTQIKEVAS